MRNRLNFYLINHSINAQIELQLNFGKVNILPKTKVFLIMRKQEFHIILKRISSTNVFHVRTRLRLKPTNLSNLGSMHINL